MAKFADVNRSTAANANGEVLYRIKETLVAAGWTVQASGDGLAAYSAVGDVFTTPAAGATGMNNSLAWFRIQDPGGRREFIFQRGTMTTSARVVYSALDKFTTGGAFNVLPTATDGQYILGSASPFYGTIASGSYYSHVIAQSTPEGDVYGWWFLATVVGTGAAAGGMYCEPLAVGSYSALDADPLLLATSAAGWGVTLSTPLYKWYKLGLTGAAFLSGFGAAYYTNGTILGNSAIGVGVNPYDGSDNTILIPVFKSSIYSSPGWIGFMKYTKFGSVGRSYPDTINLASDAYVFTPSATYVVIPWPDGIAPTL